METLNIILLLLSGFLIYIGAYHGIYKRRIPKTAFGGIEIKGSIAFAIGLVSVIYGIYGLYVVIKSFWN